MRSDLTGVAPSALAGAVDPDDDYLTVALLCAGLAEILRRRERAAAGEKNAEGILPASWRSGFARLWWRCFADGVPAVEDDLRLLGLCAEPMVTWPVALALSEIDLQQTLLVGERLSEFAEQGARLSRGDVEAEWV
jgi:hypothetical protein